MDVSDFDYDLPQELIAQHPVEPRHNSRLLLVDRVNRTMRDRIFYDLPELLRAGDLLVFNDTRVIPARLHGWKTGPGRAMVEVFLLKEHSAAADPNSGAGEWECLVKPGKRLKPGARIEFPGEVSGEICAFGPDGSRMIRFHGERAQGVNFRAWLAATGETPLPPYINAKLDNPERYQTVYARQEGSVAAPTAGLHFTPEILERLNGKGVSTAFLTLHVGIGTFRPVQVEKVEEHTMHPEVFTLPEELVRQIAATKQAGGRVIAVGTTVVRVLESQAATNGELRSGSGETAIFIYPGYRFKVVDALLTNFHLPKSTLLMLVSALAGRELIMECYQHAVREHYRFFSFGDAMLIQ